MLGDSLSAGYGIDRDQAWPALLQARLGAEYSVVNASISGETTSGGRARLPQLLARHRPHLVIVALGANDGLRGLPLQQMRDNLDAMIRQNVQHQSRTLLVGIRMPPNYGAYADAFARVFDELAQTRKVPLVPFLLEGFADQVAYFQADGLHPTAAAQPLILDNVVPSIRAALR
ncbi:MAG TPA: arylesterase [Rhodocyclaceae bacterium]